MNAPPPFSALLERPLGVVSPWGWIVHVALLLLYLKMSIYLVVLGLSCGMWDLHCAMQDLFVALEPAGSVVLRHVGSTFPSQGSNPCPLHCKADS